MGIYLCIDPLLQLWPSRSIQCNRPWGHYYSPVDRLV